MPEPLGHESTWGAHKQACPDVASDCQSLKRTLPDVTPRRLSSPTLQGSLGRASADLRVHRANDFGQAVVIGLGLPDPGLGDMSCGATS